MSNPLGTSDESYLGLVKHLVETVCPLDLSSWERKGL